jgi:hypothetical protein
MDPHQHTIRLSRGPIVAARSMRPVYLASKIAFATKALDS